MPKRLRQAVVCCFGSSSDLLERRGLTRAHMIEELERRGYGVRNKTDEQIVQLLKRGSDDRAAM